MTTIQDRRNAAEDTLAQIPAIAKLASTSYNTDILSCTFIPKQLPALSKSDPKFPNLKCKPIEIHDSDAYALARAMDPTRGLKHSNVAVLNLASNIMPGGGWRQSLCKTQEEALCYSSTLYATLKPEWFPWPNLGEGSCAGIWSPNVLVFKDTLDNLLKDLPIYQQQLVSVITVAAPCRPNLTADRENFADESVLTDLREKILLVLRMAAHNGQTKLVLGAMGCGAYWCPPRLVAREMKAAVEMEEFAGWFENLDFAVYAGGPATKSIGWRNFQIFKEVFEGKS